MGSRLLEWTSSFLEARTNRRGFLVRAALAGSALTVGPFRYLVRPGTAYAHICGPGDYCESGYTAFCCTVSGANNCPSGTFPAGWWKADYSSYCGGPRYYIDCNARCTCSCNGYTYCDCYNCSCYCPEDTCDNRAVCCYSFRYGQCNEQIECVGPIVCRAVYCSPPWEYANCTRDGAWDDNTAEHSAPCMPGG